MPLLSSSSYSRLLPQVQLYLSERVEHDYAFALWDGHLQWLKDCGFERALEVQDPPPALPLPTGHEVVDLLNSYVAETGRVNAHLGLTSSDIVDNVRLIQISKVTGLLEFGIANVITALLSRFDTGTATVGFTHWQPAALLSWSHRVQAWCAPLGASSPLIFAKKFGGPVGDGDSLAAVMTKPRPFNWEAFNLVDPTNEFPLQSSDHVCEIRVISWVAQIAAQLHKIAADLRFLASHGVILLDRPANHAGSSSMPHKLNPYKWEKVCSICRSISTTQAEIWSVAAHNGLERTLDTSWQLKSLLKRAFTGLAEAIDLMVETEATVNVKGNSKLLMQHSSVIFSEKVLTEKVLAGKSRFDAYQEMLAKANQSAP